MNPLWSLLFRARFSTPFSIYRMSLAEIVVLLSLAMGAAWGAGKATVWLVMLYRDSPGV